ncbi:hypothetical protein Leryth_006860 [Lithospermum erythrorhizon]|nr:hypothetical protein Leryth_006860 [Lithospermum erythrorhizon]
MENQSNYSQLQPNTPLSTPQISLPYSPPTNNLQKKQESEQPPLDQASITCTFRAVYNPQVMKRPFSVKIPVGNRHVSVY